MKPLRAVPVLLALLAAAASGCAPEPGGIQALPSGWGAIQPGGETSCEHGDPFRFHVRPGKVNRVVVEFRGGGACWSAATCADEALFQVNAEPDRFLIDERAAEGIHDHANPENPVRDWHHVYIPYCTADVHWGDNVVTYGEGREAITVRHKGVANARAVLRWLAENLPSPERVLVTGCSAGAYGAIMWAPHVQRLYPSARVVQLGDAGAGVITEAFFRQSYPSWRPASAYPTWIPGVDPGATTSLSELYIAIGRHHPEMRLSEVSTILDEDQIFRFQLMGGGAPAEWAARMLESIAAIEAEVPEFHAYIAPGTRHCTIPDDALYTTTAGGVRFVDWLEDLVTGRPLRSVRCEGCGDHRPR